VSSVSTADAALRGALPLRMRRCGGLSIADPALRGGLSIADAALRGGLSTADAALRRLFHCGRGAARRLSIADAALRGSLSIADPALRWQARMARCYAIMTCCGSSTLM
jgi:hypothetical protein